MTCPHCKKPIPEAFRLTATVCPNCQRPLGNVDRNYTPKRHYYKPDKSALTAFGSLAIVLVVILIIFVNHTPNELSPSSPLKAPPVVTLTPSPTLTPSAAPNIIELKTSNKSIPQLEEWVTTVYPVSVSDGDLDYTIIGVAFGSHDSHVDLGLNSSDVTDSLIDAFSIGVSVGFADLGNTDAYLAVYYYVSPGKNITSPRDVKSVKINAYVDDDRGSKGFFITNTLENEFPTLHKKSWGMVLFGVYSDSKYFDITLGDCVAQIKSKKMHYYTE